MQNKLSERQLELDVIKAWAIIAVVLIHGISLSYQYFERGGVVWSGLLVADQFLRFCVPVFVALSGYGLGIKNMDVGKRYGEFIKRRVLKLLPWYLFWSGVIYFYIRIGNEWNYVEHFPWWKVIFMGKADYHLYFVPMIVSLYLIFPLIAWGIKKWAWKLVLVLGILQAILYVATSLEAEKIVRLSFAWGDQQQYLFFGTWIFYFALGIYLNFLPGVMVRKSKLIKTIALTAVLVGFAAIVLDTLRLIGNGADIIAATRFTRVPVLLFATGFIISSLVWRRFWLKFPEIFVWIGERSFIIYLSHTLILRELVDVIKPESIGEAVVFFAASFMLSAILAEGVYQAAKGTSGAWRKVFKARV